MRYQRSRRCGKSIAVPLHSSQRLIDADGRQQMIYKHAISTIAPLSPIDLHEADETGEE